MRGGTLSPDSVATPVDNETVDTSVIPESPFSAIDSQSVDMRHYNQLMSSIPMQMESVPLVLNSMVEQVVATVDGTNPADLEPPKREDGLHHTLGNYLDKKLAFYGLHHGDDFWYSQPEKNINPQIVYYGNASGLRLSKFGGKQDYFNPVEVEGKMFDLHPFSHYKSLLNSSSEQLDNLVRHEQLFNFYSKTSPVSKKKFERAMRQYIFESLSNKDVDGEGKL